MGGLLSFDRALHQREIDAAVRAAAIQQMASKPKRQAFSVQHLQDRKISEAAGKRADVLQVVAQQTQTGEAAARKVVVGLPEQTGGLRAVSVDGSIVGHAQKVPEEIRKSWGFEWAFKAVVACDLEYFESLAEIRSHALSLQA